jgi:MATE family multidrug resistance protein
MWLASSELHRLGIEAAVLPDAVYFLRVVSVSLLPVLLFVAVRRYLQAVGLVRAVMFSAFSANAVNLFVNWVLVFGNLGAPALGARGSAWATTISRVYMFFFLVGYLLWHARHNDPALLRVSLAPDTKRLASLVRLGFPAACQTTLEVGVFTAATLLAARLDPLSLAAHQIALGAAALSFMVPLGVSSAGAVRVGQALGRGDPAAAARAGWTALVLGAAFMCCAALTFVLVPHVVMRIFTSEPAVIAMGISLLAVAAIFQLFDGLQVVASGVLRGTGDTRTAMAASLFGYWVLGLPIGYALCFAAGLGVVGLWVGLSVGLISVAVVLVSVWSLRVKKLAPIAIGAAGGRTVIESSAA